MTTVRRVPVVHVITKLELGGAQQNTLYTLAHLDRHRFEPCLVAGCGGLLDEDARHLEGVSVSWVPQLLRQICPWNDLLALLAIRRRLRQIRETSGPTMIVHTHSSKAGILGRWAAWLAGATVVVHTFHGFGFHPAQPGWLRRLLIRIERMTARITDGVIVVSTANQRQGTAMGLFRDGGHGADRPLVVNPRGEPPAVLIRSGIDFSEFRSRGLIDGGASADETVRRQQRLAMRAAMGIPPDAPVVVTVACLKPQKAPMDVVAVAGRVRRRVPSAHFLIVGDGELRPQMESLVRAEGLGDRVILLGWRRDVADLLGLADLFLLTSRWEGLPRAILEAMLAGLPVVATAVDGVTDVVQDGTTGYVVPVGDLDRMADCVTELLQQPERRRHMGAAARSLPDEFDIGLMVRRQEDFYLQLLEAKGVQVGECAAG